MSYNVNLLSFTNPIVLADNGIIVDGSGSAPKAFTSDKYKITNGNINVSYFDGFHSSTDNRLKHQIGYNFGGSSISLPTCNICKKTPGDIGVINLPLNLRAFYAIIVGGGGGGGGGNTNGYTVSAGFGAGAGGCIGQYIELTNKTKQYKLIGSVGAGGNGGILGLNPTDGATGQFSYLMILDNFNNQVFGMKSNGGRGGWGGNTSSNGSSMHPGPGGTCDVSLNFANVSTFSSLNSIVSGGSGGATNNRGGGAGGVSKFSFANTGTNAFKLFNNPIDLTKGPPQAGEGPALSIGAGGGGGHGSNKSITPPGLATNGKNGNPGAIYVFYLY
jgi:hypothetical protein